MQERLTRRGILAGGGAIMLTACAPQEASNGAQTQQAGGSLSPAGCWPDAQPRALPFAVQEIYPAAHQGRIHVIGGLRGADGRVVGVSDAHLAYDPASGETATLTPLPDARHHPYAVSHAGRLYVLGGFGTNPGAVNWIMSTQTLVHDGDAWTRLADAPVPHGEVTAASLGGRIHLVGGRTPTGAANLGYGDHADTTHHLVFDPGANAWSQAAPALAPRNSAAGAVIDGLWHVAGGRTVTGGPTDAHEVYDPREDRWRAAAPMPAGSGAGGNAAAVLDGALYVFGGEVFGQPGIVHPEVWRYDPKTDAWDAAAPMPTPRHGVGAVALDGSIYLVGGATQPSGVGTSAAVERFTLSCGGAG